MMARRQAAGGLRLQGAPSTSHAGNDFYHIACRRPLSKSEGGDYAGHLCLKDGAPVDGVKDLVSEDQVAELLREQGDAAARFLTRFVQAKLSTEEALEAAILPCSCFWVTRALAADTHPGPPRGSATSTAPTVAWPHMRTIVS